MHAGGHVSELLILRQASSCLLWWLDSSEEAEHFWGELRAFFFLFFNPFFPEDVSEGQLFGVLGYLVLCLGGIVYSVIIKVELTMFPSTHAHLHGVDSTSGSRPGRHQALLERQRCRMIESRAL